MTWQDQTFYGMIQSLKVGFMFWNEIAQLSSTNSGIRQVTPRLTNLSRVDHDVARSGSSVELLIVQHILCHGQRQARLRGNEEISLNQTIALEEGQVICALRFLYL
jgi:hypothetical protein